MYATLHGCEGVVAAARELSEPVDDGGCATGLGALVDQVCAEAGTWAPDAARGAIAQSSGDVARAVTLVRVWAATLPVVSTLALRPVDLRVQRRVSAAFAEVPGGQWLGSAPQLASRLLRWPADHEALALTGRAPGDANGTDPISDAGTALAEPGPSATARAAKRGAPTRADCPRVADLLDDVPIVPAAAEAEGPDPVERPLTLPASRGARLAALARGETGALVTFAGLAHARQREEVLTESTLAVAELRIAHPRTGAPVRVAEVPVAEAEVITDAEVDGRPGFALGYGASLGALERRAIAAAIIDGGLQAGAHGALGEAQLLGGIDGSATTGFVEHLCLPHYASFASYLGRVGAELEEEE